MHLSNPFTAYQTAYWSMIFPGSGPTRSMIIGPGSAEREGDIDLDSVAALTAAEILVASEIEETFVFYVGGDRHDPSQSVFLGDNPAG